MSGSSFRKNVQDILQKTPDNTEASQQIVHLLRDNGVSLKLSWGRALLEPSLLGIRERSLGDTRLEALELCRFMVADLGIDLVSPGLVSTDRKVMARLGMPLPELTTAEPSRRPSLS